MSKTQSVIGFAHTGPFFPMVSAFLASCVGLGPVFDTGNPLKLSREQAAWFSGKITSPLAIDLEQVRQMAAVAGIDVALRSLCCMLVNTAYDSVESRNDQSPEFEFFRHVRNAASHGNEFWFSRNEPSRPAAWRGLVIDDTRKGQNNSLHTSVCFGGLLEPADAIFLLWDIEKRCV